MPIFVEMDERVPLSAQMEEKLGPVVLVPTRLRWSQMRLRSC
jgi:hypothetical protein